MKYIYKKQADPEEHLSSHSENGGDVRQREAVEHKLVNDIKDERKRTEQDRKCRYIYIYMHVCMCSMMFVCIYLCLCARNGVGGYLVMLECV